MTTEVTLEVVPVTCTVADVCRLLKISRPEFYAKRARLRALGILVPLVPAIGRRPKFQGAAIAQFLGADGQAKHVKQALRLVQPSRLRA